MSVTDPLPPELEHDALRSSEARLAGIIASAMDAIISVDQSGRIALFNRAAEDIFGYAAAEAIGMPLDRLIPERHREAHREHVRRFGQSGETSRRMGRLTPLSGRRRTGEEFPIEATISHSKTSDGLILTVILRDISERRRLEEQLLHAQRLESVGRLAGGIAHDFNNALTAIFGYVDLTLACPDLDPSVGENVRAIQVAAQRAADLTRKLLAFARKQVIEPRVVDINRVVGGVMDMIGRLLGDDIHTVLRTDPTAPNVQIDAGQFEQVLVNLAVNARDAMPRGGKFVVETALVHLDENYVGSRPGLAPGPYVMIAVSDTGVGMDPVTLEHCFEPFFTTKETGRGTGLGLSMCYGAVHQAGGDIWVYSEKGRGTTFRILLPVCSEPVQTEAPPTTAAPCPSGETVLLVEDDEMVRSVAVRALHTGGYAVLEAGSADEALAIEARHPGSIHLLLTDVMLPGASGRDLAEELIRRRPGIRVLFTSGFAGDVVEHHGAILGGVAFLPKPYTPSALAKKLRETLEGR
jgi:PAS domain S-box-containing protein